MLRFRLPPLYAILDVDELQTRGLEPRVVLSTWLDAGIRLVQLRAKTMDSGPFLELADEAAAITRSASALFIVNDRADIARLSGADGVHVGQGDLTPADVRRVVGDGAVVGMSTHSEGQARAALETSIDYLAIGPVHETRSKARPDPTVGLAGVARAASLASPRGVPVVAIGGITLERAPAILEAGASSVAVISDLLQPDLALRARQFLEALGDH